MVCSLSMSHDYWQWVWLYINSFMPNKALIVSYYHFVMKIVASSCSYRDANVINF